MNSNLPQPRDGLEWPTAPQSLCLPPNEVHVYALRTEVSPQRETELATKLSEDERRTWQRFRVPPPKRQFVVSRSALRFILSELTNIAAEKIDIVRESAGKPYCVGLPAEQTVCFNISHCDGLALVALSRCGSVGVDVERAVAKTDIESISRQIFCDNEARLFQDLSLDERRRFFFTVWTRKEALLKNLGLGFSWDPRTVDVSDIEQPLSAHSVTVQDLRPATDFFAAVAHSPGNVPLRCWALTPERIPW